MKITIVTAYFWPEISPITHLYADLAADLAAYGADVTVVTGPAVRGLDEETRAAYRARTDERAPEGYRILRTGGGREGTNFILRGLRLLFGAWALYRKARRVPTDAYLLGSMPPFLGLIGAWLNKRARTVYVLQDIFPDSMLMMGRFSESHPIVRLWDIPEVSVAVSGMGSMADVEANLRYASKAKPNMLTPDERKALGAAIRAFRQAPGHIDCTGCSQCIPCPHNVAIGYIFAYVYNNYLLHKNKK